MKKFISLVLVLSLALLVIVNADTASNLNRIGAGNDVIYENHYTVDLRDINLSVQENQIVIEPKMPNNQSNRQEIYMQNAQYSTQPNNSQDENLLHLKNMLKNKDFHKDLMNMIKSGNTPFAIGVAEAYILKTIDVNGNEVYSRPMTQEEVKKLKDHGFQSDFQSISGQTQVYNKLSLYTSVSGTSPSYWVQSNSYWEGSSSNSTGDDYIGVTWASDFIAQNDSRFTGTYITGASISGALCKAEPTAGLCWQFADTIYVNPSVTWTTQSVYAGVTIRKTISGSKQYGIVSSYIHTYKNISYSVQIGYSSDGVYGGNITLAPVDSQWTLQSYLTTTM